MGSMTRTSTVIALLLLASACADPRLNFIGAYDGSIQNTETFPDGTSNPHTGTTTVTIVAPKNTNQLTLTIGRNPCAVAADVVGDTQFTLPTTVCPTERAPSNALGLCDYTEVFTNGTGTLSGASLTLTARGTGTVSNCEQDRRGVTYTFTMTLALARK